MGPTLARARAIALSLAGLLAQGRCQLCAAPIEHATSRQDGLCPDCAETLRPRQGGYCPGCGLMYGLESTGLESSDQKPVPPVLCSGCRTSPRPWDGLAFHSAYEGRLRDLVLEHKLGFRLERANLLGRLLIQAYMAGMGTGLGGSPPEVIVPVPLHPRRLAWRGFNQSLEMVRPLSRLIQVPIEPQTLERRRRTIPQAGLSGSARRENIRGAFEARPELLTGRSVLLVDDILTTGATLEECARVLRQAGATKVLALVLLRA